MLQGSVVQGIVLFKKNLVRGTTYLEILSKEYGKVKGVVRLDKKDGARHIVGKDVVCENTSRQQADVPFLVVHSVCDEASFLPIMNAPLPLLVLQSALDVCRLAPESESCDDVVEKLEDVRTGALAHAVHDVWKAAYIALELCVLRVMGFGMSINECVVTKSQEGLAFISPNTGASVVEKVGRPYAQRLLAYPGAFAKILKKATLSLSDKEFFEALSVVGFFLHKHSRRYLMREQMMLWQV